MSDSFELRWIEMVDGVPTIRYNKVEDERDFMRQLGILKNNEAVQEVKLYSAKTAYKKGE